MKLRVVYLLVLLLIPILSCKPAEERLISGVVTQESDDMPLPGVDVQLQGTDVKVQTDFDGLYEIKAKEGNILVFSYIKNGKTQELKVTSKDSINVQLKPAASD